MTRTILGVFILVAPFLANALEGQSPAEADRIPVLAELFTSEGCSSCPPADRLLESVSREQPVEGVYVVAMSQHVTYWDHQGWKDPFGSPRFTQRQSMYAGRFRLDDVFTPQLVIDGSTQMVGSDAGQLRRALTEAARASKPRLTVEAVLTGQAGLVGSVSGPGLAAGATEGAELLWAVTEDDLSVEVKRGENARRTLRHSGVVRTLISRRIDPTKASQVADIRLQSGWKREKLRLVAFVQSTKSKRVLSVGWALLSGTP
jgi:hypothetical protein